MSIAPNYATVDDVLALQCFPVFGWVARSGSASGPL